MDAHLRKIQEIRLFRGVDRSAIADLLQSCATFSCYQPGEEIFAVGSHGQEMFILPTGRVRVLLSQDANSQKEIPIRGPDIFGEMAFLDQGPRSGTAIAEESLELYRLDRIPTQEYFTRHPALGLEIMRNLTIVLARKLRRTNAVLLQELRHLPDKKGDDADGDTSEATTMVNPESVALQASLSAFARTRNSGRFAQSIVP
ncbi:MAG: cyclic nucleotide-binding domain-containing protein [Magnetococcales bacterium]|nr:cyclic nucleotide-binding domain-containing protein [Magnetococcales bacterium]